MATFLDRVAGRYRQIIALVTSAGVADADKIVATGSDGRLDPSLMPTGLAPAGKLAAASETLASGAWVNLWNDGGTLKVRNADATTEGKECHGFVKEAAAADDDVFVYSEGENPGVTAMTPGARVYLSTTPGVGTMTPPSADGNVVQLVGIATSATEVLFREDDGVIIAV